MRLLKSHPILKLVNSYLIDSPQPSNISYLWNFGSLLAFCLVIQIITGVTLAMHYNANVVEAFDSVEHIMRDVNNGWLLRYLHSNTASAFFFLVYLHIGRGLYYGSYRAPRTLVWTIGTVIFILMMATAFLGYVLPYGQMSLWGATVITNLMSAIPWIGQDIVEFLWGGFSVNNATLNRFFALHYVLPFVLAALALMHLIALHDSAGSGNPLGISGNCDRLPFAPYFIFKDLVTIFLFIIIISVFVFFMPNILGDSENYVMANPMQTPPAIVPEWYLLPFYAILRSIPNKLLGVIAMFLAILILLTMPFTDLSRSRGIQFRPFSKIAFFIFVTNFLILMQLGAKHVESPFIEFGQISTIIFFSYFLILVPLLSLFENSLLDLSSSNYKSLSIYSKPKSFNKLLNQPFSRYHFLYTDNVFYFFYFTLYFIFFCLFIYILYLILSKYGYLDYPYGFEIDYCINEGLDKLHDSKYAKYTIYQLKQEQLDIKKEHSLVLKHIASCKSRHEDAHEMYRSFSVIPAIGISVKDCSLKMLNHANPYIIEFKQKSIAFERELAGWQAQEQDLLQRAQEVKSRIEQWNLRLANTPWPWERPSTGISAANYPYKAVEIPSKATPASTPTSTPTTPSSYLPYKSWEIPSKATPTSTPTTPSSYLPDKSWDIPSKATTTPSTNLPDRPGEIPSKSASTLKPNSSSNSNRPWDL